MHAVAQADPGQKFLHVVVIVAFVAAGQTQGQGDIVESRKMVEQAEILEHHADAAADGGKVLAARRRQIVAEQGDQAA